jgi:hypothetical protein
MRLCDNVFVIVRLRAVIMAARNGGRREKQIKQPSRNQNIEPQFHTIDSDIFLDLAYDALVSSAWVFKICFRDRECTDPGDPSSD